MGYKNTVRKDPQGNILPVGIYWKKERYIHFWYVKKALKRQECQSHNEAQIRADSELKGYVVVIPAHYQINVSCPKANQPYHRISANVRSWEAAQAKLQELLKLYPKVDRRKKKNHD